MNKRAHIRLVVADDHRLVLEAVRAIFSREDDIEVVATVHRATQLLPTVAREEPDVVLLDVRMPEIDGWACLQLIRRRYPDVAVVLLSALPLTDLDRALEEGAAAVVSKSVDPGRITDVVRRVALGEQVGLVGHAQQRVDPDLGLSAREVSILKALARGRSNREIAGELFIAEQTVKFHLTNIYAKLDVPNRTGAARLAFASGLVESPLAPV
ncbi:MAG TPA: response regulator transcription factor [Gaiellaceae bacterium]